MICLKRPPLRVSGVLSGMSGAAAADCGPPRPQKSRADNGVIRLVAFLVSSGFMSVSDASTARSFHDQLRVQLPRLVKLLDDRDAILGRHLELVERVHQVLQLRP